MYSVVCCSFLTQKNFIIPNSLSEYSISTKSNVDDNALEYLRWKTYSICYCLHAIPLFNSVLSALEAILSHKIKTIAKYQALNKGTFSVFRSCTSFNGKIECPHSRTLHGNCRWKSEFYIVRRLNMQQKNSMNKTFHGMKWIHSVSYRVFCSPFFCVGMMLKEMLLMPSRIPVTWQVIGYMIKKIDMTPLDGKIMTISKRQ